MIPHIFFSSNLYHLTILKTHRDGYENHEDRSKSELYNTFSPVTCLQCRDKCTHLDPGLYPELDPFGVTYPSSLSPGKTNKQTRNNQASLQTCDTHSSHPTEMKGVACLCLRHSPSEGLSRPWKWPFANDCHLACSWHSDLWKPMPFIIWTCSALSSQHCPFSNYPSLHHMDMKFGQTTGRASRWISPAHPQ